MLGFRYFVFGLVISLSACEKVPVRGPVDGASSPNGASARVEVSPDNLPQSAFKIADHSRQTLDKAKRLEQEAAKAAQVQSKEIDDLTK
ncbi:hypothetical protein [Undibacterium fentianense]|uniref:Lipoprotein n=1 Tax=Undibacterium fentianense TaxID=2828728 RepID=A0A941E1S9_9BURK|nr:hypothetical protein [Undibacterium fentianense]MBR7801699.1 hypothetical protein [Undibacterium fentianense]